jgi:hypothetical protein
MGVTDIKRKLRNLDSSKLIEIEPPMPGESFRIMEDFIYSLPENAHELKSKLVQALNRRKPFQNFKYVIDGSGKYRDQ